jgi:transcriptional regulator with XRE-family HTH domain
MEHLRELMRLRGVSQRKLAKLAGIDLVTVSHILTGKVSPTVRTLEKIAGALGVEVSELFGEDFSEAGLDALTEEGVKIRAQLRAAAAEGDMVKTDYLLQRAAALWDRIRQLDPPLARIHYTPDRKPEVLFYRSPTEEELQELREKVGDYVEVRDLLLIA